MGPVAVIDKLSAIWRVLHLKASIHRCIHQQSGVSHASIQVHLCVEKSNQSYGLSPLIDEETSGTLHAFTSAHIITFRLNRHFEDV